MRNLSIKLLYVLLDDVEANEEFQVEIKPPQGATYTIHRKAPPAIATVMTLV